MKLLNEIIDLLANERGSLNSALLKTKVLLRTIGENRLVDWVSDELTGYPNDAVLPTYRKLSARVLGNVSDGWQTVSYKMQIPLTGFPDKFRNEVEVLRFRQALGVLEKMVEGDDGKRYLSSALEPALLEPLGTILTGGFYFERVWSQVELFQVRQLVIEVRSRLLDFILELQEKIGDSMTDKDAKSAAALIDVPSIFNGAVIGDNATFQIGGNNNQQRVRNRNARGDRTALAAELRKHGVDEDDIVALDVALLADKEVTVEGGKFGPAVKGWIKTMLGKAVDASWNIELGIASGLLTNALVQYYGV